MELIHFKIMLLLNAWVAKGSPVAMLQHATSSQSIVFHTGLESSTAAPKPSSAERYNSRQPKYEYKYEVSDQQTGDRKSHWESREGDTVRGVYTLYEPDGAFRTVEYTADALHGFNAVVKRTEPNKHQSFNHKPTNDISHNDGLSSEHTNAFSTNKHNRDNPSYSEKSSSHNSGVDFSVNHVFKKFRDNHNLY